MVQFFLLGCEVLDETGGIGRLQETAGPTLRLG
jgi:hypothetical protein